MFVEHMVEVFRAVKRVLRDDGVCFINITDSYSGSGKGPTGKAGVGKHTERQGFTDPGAYKGIPAKNMCLVPERLLIALQDDGWIVRSKIRLIKVSAMPESVEDRPSNATEELYMLTKLPRYFYDADAVRTEAEYGRRSTFRSNQYIEGRSYDNTAARVEPVTNKGSDPSAGANLKNWWYWTPEHNTVEFCTGCYGYFEGALDKRRIRRKKVGDKTVSICPDCGADDKWLAHYAAFPTWLPRRCIEAGTSSYGACAKCGAPWKRVVEHTNAVLKPSARNAEKKAALGKLGATQFQGAQIAPARNITIDWEPTCTCMCPDLVPCRVCDPFSGTGTTALVADRLGRHGIGLELNDGYYQYSLKRLTSDAPLVAAVEEAEKATQMGLFEEEF
jgi:DNA modification methylase